MWLCCSVRRDSFWGHGEQGSMGPSRWYRACPPFQRREVVTVEPRKDFPENLLFVNSLSKQSQIICQFGKKCTMTLFFMSLNQYTQIKLLPNCQQFYSILTLDCLSLAVDFRMNQSHLVFEVQPRFLDSDGLYESAPCRNSTPHKPLFLDMAFFDRACPAVNHLTDR